MAKRKRIEHCQRCGFRARKLSLRSGRLVCNVCANLLVANKSKHAHGLRCLQELAGGGVRER